MGVAFFNRDKKMKKILTILLLMVVFTSNLLAIDDQTRFNISYYLKLSQKLNEDMSELLRDFEAYLISPDLALQKLRDWRNKFNEQVKPIPKEIEKLHRLQNEYLSLTEELLLYYKKTNQINNNIMNKAKQILFELIQEVTRIKYLAK